MKKQGELLFCKKFLYNRHLNRWSSDGKKGVKDNGVLEGHGKGQELQRKSHELQMGEENDGEG